MIPTFCFCYISHCIPQGKSQQQQQIHPNSLELQCSSLVICGRYLLNIAQNSFMSLSYFDLPSSTEMDPSLAAKSSLANNTTQNSKAEFLSTYCFTNPLQCNFEEAVQPGPLLNALPRWCRELTLRGTKNQSALSTKVRIVKIVTEAHGTPPLSQISCQVVALHCYPHKAFGDTETLLPYTNTTSINN